LSYVRSLVLADNFDSYWERENGADLAEGMFHQSGHFEIKVKISTDTSGKHEPDTVSLVAKWTDGARTLRADLLRQGRSLRKSDWRVDARHLFPQDGSQPHGIRIPPLDALADLADTFYLGPFRHALSGPGRNDYFDGHTGAEFLQLWSELKTGGSSQKRRRLMEITDRIASVFGLSRLELAPGQDGLIVNIDGRRSLSLDELGSGFSQFVMALTPVAFQNPSYVLIDEPELHLHPRLQLEFLTTLATFAKRGVMYATHGLGLARASAEQVYVVAPGNDGCPTIRPLLHTGRLPELLGGMSFGGYSELGCETILLVEGATDIKTYREWLGRRRKDGEVVVLQLGGSSMINGRRHHELAELRRLGARVFAVIDSERDSAHAPLAADRKQFQRACERLGILCHVLDRRATENYIPATAVQRVAGDSVPALGKYEKRLD
jgi:energy-coupling factor transporter ATP-binding protein EcfA2